MSQKRLVTVVPLAPLVMGAEDADEAAGIEFYARRAAWIDQLEGREAHHKQTILELTNQIKTMTEDLDNLYTLNEDLGLQVVGWKQRAQKLEHRQGWLLPALSGLVLAVIGLALRLEVWG